jgi:hypothetical protein
MKSKVLDRPMFKKPNKDMDPENVGIMQGFADMLDEDELAAIEGVEEKDYDTASMQERTPKSPEILMNNLRGDMRSIDARVEELADLVGYNAASSTPTEVLALLQPVLAAEAQQGIGSLPGAGLGQTPPGAMPPPGMPPGMPPAAAPNMGGMPPGMDMPAVPNTSPAGMPEGGIASLMAGAGGGQEPIQMAAGGIVQRFQAGSTEEGVTPADEATSAVGTYSPEMISQARNEVMTFLTRQPLAVPDLARETQKRVPLYEKILGIDKNISQGQALMDIAQAAFNYAANVDEQGRPLRGSAMSRLSRAAAPLPGKIGARVAEQAKADQAIKLTALQATEKDIQNIRAQNAKLVETQRKTWADIAKSQGTTPFGTGKEGRILSHFTSLAPNYAAGKTTPDQDRIFETAVKDYTQRQEVETVDPVTGNKSVRVIRNELPSFVSTAIAARARLGQVTGETQPPMRSEPRPQGQGSGTTAPAAAPAAAAPAPALGSGVRPLPTQSGGEAPQEAGTPPEQQIPNYSRVDPLRVQPQTQSYFTTAQPTMFGASFRGTGVPSAVGSAAYRIPLIGPSIGSREMSEARNYLDNTVNRINRSVATSPRFAEGERQQIQKQLDLTPGLLDNPTAYRSRLFVLDDYLIQLQDEALRNTFNQQLTVAQRQQAREKATEIHGLRELVGSPLRIYSANDPRLQTLPPGTPFLWNGEEWRRTTARQRNQ